MSQVKAIGLYNNSQAFLGKTSVSSKSASLQSAPKASSNGVLEKSKNNKKIVIGGLAALAAASIGIAYVVIKHKAPKEITDTLTNAPKLENKVEQLAQDPVTKITHEIDDIAKKCNLNMMRF